MIDFIEPIQLLGKKTGAHYIITTMEYLTIWVEAQLIKDYMGATTTKFLFEYVLPIFDCSKVMMSDKGIHFLNETIKTLTEEF